ncbi:MAG: hypothetical protein ACRC48_06665 [Aeromonas veronii]
MKHDNDHLRFPSGNTVEFVRKKAKKLVKAAKLEGRDLKLAAALDLLAADNGVVGGWAAAMTQIKQVT